MIHSAPACMWFFQGIFLGLGLCCRRTWSFVCYTAQAVL